MANATLSQGNDITIDLHGYAFKRVHLHLYVLAETWMVRIGKLGLPFVPLALRSQLERTS